MVTQTWKSWAQPIRQVLLYSRSITECHNAHKNRYVSIAKVRVNPARSRARKVRTKNNRKTVTRISTVPSNSRHELSDLGLLVPGNFLTKIIVINVIQNTMYQLSSSKSRQGLGQQISKIVVSPDMSHNNLLHRNCPTDSMVAN